MAIPINCNEGLEERRIQVNYLCRPPILKMRTLPMRTHFKTMSTQLSIQRKTQEDSSSPDQTIKQQPRTCFVKQIEIGR
jgi:hypothetical protein